MEKSNNYALLIQQVQQVIDPQCSLTGNLSNITALVYDHVPGLNWVGFYFKKGDHLVLNTFQGKIACTLIPMTRGVCGKAARTRSTIVVDDVHQFEDHIACDSASNSEIVVPLFKNKRLYGVFDIDSFQFARFQKEEQELMEAIARIIEIIL